MNISYNPNTGRITGYADDKDGIGGVTIHVHDADLPGDFFNTYWQGQYQVSDGVLVAVPGWTPPEVSPDPTP